MNASSGDSGGGSPARSRPHPERSCFRAATQRPSGAGALRMRRGAGAGLRALSGVVSAAPRAPARPPPARAPRRGHAVSHVAGDQGDPGGPVQLRHPPHPLRDSLVHLPRCGLRPRHLSAAGPPGRHAGGVRGGRALGTERSRGAPSLALETPAPGPAAGPAPPPGLDLQRRAGESGSPKALENAGGCGVMCLHA
uniref:WAS/WASL-interacting protein family member 2-like isoform X2 n=1 Tax=Callithrix jacchus TaxID=9483 RepID=UPI0023DCF131|nr:WAS/WASL-interacting protein family member 2-like isoform X2 [Callithrix jacchus]